MVRISTILLLFFLGTSIMFSQKIDAQKDLLKRAIENHKSFFINSEKAFEEAQNLEKRAFETKQEVAELLAINTQCVYYKTKNDYEKVITKAKSLLKKAEQYNNFPYQTFAKIWIFEFYDFNQLDDRAFSELEDGKRIIDKADSRDSLVIKTKSNLYLAYANYYVKKSDYKNQLKYVRLSMIEHQKNPDKQYRQKLEFLDYSNLAAVYLNVSKDSTKYYAELSMSNDIGYDRKDVQFSNLVMIGLVEFEKKNYKKALQYFQKAEKVVDFKNNIDIQTLYNKIVETYQALQDHENLKKYEVKRDSLKLNISENRNKSLLQLLNNKEEKTPQYFWYLYVFICFIILMAILIFIIVRKNRSLSLQERTSQNYLNESQEREPDYFKLLHLLEEKDSAFINYFDKDFPSFSKKLMGINPKIIQTEIEFCALLKLKIPTKDIAQYKYITPKTVQNKKYIIRKKLNIPKNIDIYQWFDLL